MTQSPKSAGQLWYRQDQWYRRYWILALLAGIEEAGASPIALRNFSLLAYLANVVAQCYGVSALNPTVLKRPEGPMYPLLNWDVDRMVGMGLILVSNVVIDSDNNPGNVSYAISEKGLLVLDGCKQLQSKLAMIAESLRSTALAYARNRSTLTAEKIAKFDANYADSTVSNGGVIDFGDWTDVNASANSVDFILDRISVALRKDPAMGVNLYAHYLAYELSVGGKRESQRL